MIKGSNMSSEASKKVSKSKMDSHICTVSNSSPGVDVNVGSEFAIPSHRKNKRFSSIDEYVSKLESTRWSVKQFEANGYSKKQVGFFNYVLKGKLKLSKGDFERKYCREFMPLEQIAKESDIPNELMTFVREHFGIKRIGSKGLARGRNELEFTDKQKQIIIGSLMGDGSLSPSGYFHEKHGAGQLQYLRWKYRELLEHCVESDDVKSELVYDKRFDKSYFSCCMRTRNHSYLKELRSKLYPKGTKVVLREVLDSITPLGLAVWYMDDGGISFSFNEDLKPVCIELKLFTCSFTDDENFEIVSWLKDVWGVVSKVRHKKSNKRNPYIFVYGQEANRFLDVVRGHIVPSMEYKCDALVWLSNRLRRGINRVPGANSSLDRDVNIVEVSEKNELVRKSQ